MTGTAMHHTEITSMNTEPTRPRITKQRQLVLDHMIATREFLTAQQVHAELRSNGESIGLATVYRALQGLAKAQLVDSIRTAEGETAYRRCSDMHHHHLICRECGRTVEIVGDELESWAQRVAAEHGFTEPEHFAEIYGLCSRC